MIVYPKITFASARTYGHDITYFLGQCEVEPYQQINNNLSNAIIDIRRRYKVARDHSNYGWEREFNNAANGFAKRYSERRLLHYLVHGNFLIRVLAKRLSEGKTINVKVFYGSYSPNDPQERGSSFFLWDDDEYKHILDRSEEVRRNDYAGTDGIIGRKIF